MLDWLTDPFASGIQQRALIEVMLLGAACGPLGVWLVSFRQAFAAESVAHAMLPGLVLAALIGAPLLLGAAGGLLLAAAAVALAGRDERLGPDTGVAIAVTSLFGLGTMLALVPDVPARLQEVLFGDLLGVTTADLVAAALLATAIALALLLLHRPLTLAAFDPGSARGLGADPARARLAVLLLLALGTLVAVQGLGNLLVVALLIAPGAAALLLADRRVPALLLAAGLACLAGLLGLLLSHHASIAAGASVAGCAVAITAAVAAARSLRPLRA
jgi:ABC-type Mn2+/Zn2+ transport system permease subunit